MPSNPIKIGPFSGGLNTYSDPTAVGDNECVDISNFDVDLDGSLVSRPAFRIQDSTLSGTGEFKLLGFFIDTDNTQYLIASTPTATYVRNSGTGVWSAITGTFGATTMVQYANKAYLVAPPSSVNPGGSWTPAGGFVAIAAMVKGASAVVYKERLFIAGGREDATNANRVFFSGAADFATWPVSTNFFDARAGDGQHIVKLAIFQDTVLIFKEDSTYAYSYDSNPSRGAVRVINTAIGTSNVNCVIEYENSLYVHHEANVYQVANWTFTLINLKVPFIYQNDPDYAPSASLSVVNDKLFVRHYDTLYIFGLRTGVWTKYTYPEAFKFNYFLKVPLDDASTVQSYYAGTRAINNTFSNRHMFYFDGTWPVDADEDMVCSVTTKSYDFNVAHGFKKLFWWGADILSKKDLTYTVHPISYTRSTTHAMMSAFQHQQIVGTHAQPLDISIDVTDSVSITNVAGNRMFIKLLKALRFRQISFTISGNTNGSSVEGPFRIYGATAFVDSKETVSKAVN